MPKAFEVKDILTVIGAVTGVFSFIRLLIGDFLNLRKKPRLTIEFDPQEDLREWNVLDGPRVLRLQRAATVHVRNKRKMPALRCVAILSAVSVPQGVTLEEKEFVLHWADTDYTGHSNIAEPVEIGPERRRLDVAFTVSVPGQDDPSVRGAWVAIPLALSNPPGARQAYLPTGEYRMRLKVKCQNGKGASMEFFLVSPETWTELSMRHGKK